MWHGYFGIENLNLNDSQRDTLVAALRALGPAAHPSPACLCHWRTRLDGQAAIFEALFDEDTLTIQAFRNRLAAIFGVDPATIDVDLSEHTFLSRPTPIAVFSRANTDYLRMALFGGPAASWSESGAECCAYLAANLTAWEEPNG
jgi:hypothetical protein